jgi:peptidoglycan hydrolase FlgJ
MIDGIGNSIGLSQAMASQVGGDVEALQMAKDRIKAEVKNEAIEKAASEFESVFLSLMLKEMRNTLDSDEGGLFGGDGSDTYGGMFDMFMGQHLSESRPLGIGDTIKAHLEGVSGGVDLAKVDLAKVAEVYSQNSPVGV